MNEPMQVKSIRLPTKLWEEIDQLSEKSEHGRSQVYRWLLCYALEAFSWQLEHESSTQTPFVSIAKLHSDGGAEPLRRLANLAEVVHQIGDFACQVRSKASFEEMRGPLYQALDEIESSARYEIPIETP